MKTLRLVLFLILVVALASAVTFTALNRVAITNSKIDSTTVGATTASTGAFTSLSSTSGASHILTPCTFDATGNTLGNSVANPIYTCTVPANTMGAGQGLRVSVVLNNTANISCSFQATFGGATLRTWTQVTTDLYWTFILKNVNGSTASQVLLDNGAIINGAFATSGFPGSAGSSAISTTVNQTLAITANCPNTTSTNGQGMVTEVIQ